MLSNLLDNWAYILLMSLILSGMIIGISANFIRLRAQRKILFDLASKPPITDGSPGYHRERFYLKLDEYEVSRRITVEAMDHHSYLLVHAASDASYEEAQNELRNCYDEIMLYGETVRNLRQVMNTSEEAGL